MAYLDNHGVETWTAEIKARCDAAYAAIDHSHEFGNVTERYSAQWAADPTYIPKKGELCVWIDYVTIDNKSIPAVKIGDGQAYAIDLPFFGDDIRTNLNNHIVNSIMHITSAERTRWNNKVDASAAGEKLMLTNN